MKIPNEETEKAMHDAEQNKNLTTHKSVFYFFKFLKRDYQCSYTGLTHESTQLEAKVCVKALTAAGARLQGYQILTQHFGRRFSVIPNLNDIRVIKIKRLKS